MKSQPLTRVLLRLMLAGGLIAASVAQAAVPSKQNVPVQHLTCKQDAQVLMCTHSEALNGSSGVKQTTVSKLDLLASQGITAEQLGQISNLLLGLMYFGLPVALVFAVLRHDRRDAERTQHIEQLKRIWERSPQP